MTSRKRRTSSKSTASATSRKTGTSSRTAATSATAPASFEEVFGPTKLRSEQALKLGLQLERAEETLAALKAGPKPTLALYRSRLTARMRRLQKYIEELREAIRHEANS